MNLKEYWLEAKATNAGVTATGNNSLAAPSCRVEPIPNHCVRLYRSRL